jgi:hypothetical protein
LSITKEEPEKMIREFQHLVMPSHHEVHASDLNLKRLGTALWLAHEQEINNFEELLLLQGVGPRTIQSLTLVSEVIHGTASRFNDPARFSFAHGGKDGNPFPVPTKIYDETIGILQTAVNKAKLGFSDKQDAIRKLHEIAIRKEKDFIASDGFNDLVQKENDNSWKYGGKTVFGNAKPSQGGNLGIQLKLF